MYKNFFTFNVYKENNDKLLEIKTFEELIEIKDNSIILPKTYQQDKEYILGDLFVNELNNELILFSCYTHHRAINKVGFFIFKNYKEFEIFSNFNLDKVNCLELSKKYFQFKKMNEIQLNNFEKIGNILLLRNEFFLNKLSKYFKFIKNNNLFNNLKEVFKKINEFEVLVSDKKNINKYISFGNKFFKHSIVSNVKLDFYPELTIINSIFNVNGFNCQIFSSKEDVKSDNNYIIYFDLNKFETYISDIENKDSICKDLFLNKSNYNIYYPFERHKSRVKKYNNAFLKTIAYI